MKSDEDKYRAALELQNITAEIDELRKIIPAFWYANKQEYFVKTHRKIAKLRSARNKLIKIKPQVIKLKPLRVA